MSKVQEFEKKLFSANISGDDPKSKEKTVDILNMVRGIIPGKLYRYRTCNEKNFDALLRDAVYFNTPSKFNDPYDCKVFFNDDLLKLDVGKWNKGNILDPINTMRNIAQSPKISDLPNMTNFIGMAVDFVKQLGDTEYNAGISKVDGLEGDIVEKVKGEVVKICDKIEATINDINANKTYIACFSEKIKSMLMWSHYADYHRGFAVEYDLRNLQSPYDSCPTKPCSYEYFVSAYPVLYRKERFDASNLLIERAGHLAMQQIYDDKMPFITPDVFLYIKANIIKALDWKYEKEWRVIYTCLEPKPKGNTITLRPKAVYLGCKISEVNERMIKELVRDKGIPTYKMNLQEKDNKFKLSYYKLPLKQGGCNNG